MPEDWGIDTGYVNSGEALSNCRALEPQQQNHSEKANWSEPLFTHIRAQFSERGKLKPGHSGVEHRGGDLYSFADIVFRYDSEVRHMCYMFNIIHFPCAVQRPMEDPHMIVCRTDASGRGLLAVAAAAVAAGCFSRVRFSWSLLPCFYV